MQPRDDTRTGDRSYRRLHRRERLLLRRIEIAIPIVLVIGAALLSMGVIKVMEVPKPGPVKAMAQDQRRELDPLGLAPPRANPDMPDMLGISLLGLEGQSKRKR